MTPVDRPDNDFATMRALHREASERVDPPPNSGVRAAVLAEAAKAIASRSSRAFGGPFGGTRWPLSMAAVLVVSVMVGLVATRAMRDEPERVAPVVAAASPRTPASDEIAPTIAPQAAPSGSSMKAAADRVASAPIDDSGARAARRPKSASRPAAPSNPAPPPAEVAAAASTRERTESAASGSTRDAAAFAERLDAGRPPAPAAAPMAAAAAPRQAPSSEASLRRAMAPRTSSEPPTPEAWVERIVSLRAGGQIEAAERELAALRLRYPDFTIPPGAIGPTGTR